MVGYLEFILQPGIFKINTLNGEGCKIDPLSVHLTGVAWDSAVCEAPCAPM